MSFLNGPRMCVLCWLSQLVRCILLYSDIPRGSLMFHCVYEVLCFRVTNRLSLLLAALPVG